MLRRSLIVLAAVALATVFLAGVIRLCLLRFRAGDVYPPLSTLRTDPLGTKAFYDTLADVEELHVWRNYRPLSKLHARMENRPLTVFYTGASLEGGSENWDDLRQLAAVGNRVVVTFAPALSLPTPSPSPNATQGKNADENEKPEAKKSEGLSGDPYSMRTEEALKAMGLLLHFEKPWLHGVPDAHAVAKNLEPVLSWHSVAWFETTRPRRTALYSCANKPVLVECPVGAGTVVFSSDSYFITNEALRNERAPALLAALVGNNREIVFDEAHHGVRESLGVVMLFRRYRLEGVFGVLGLVAALYVWKSATPLLPRDAGREKAGDGLSAISGRDAASGFVNLLRRSIATSELLSVCVDEWNKTFAHQRGRIDLPPESNTDPVRQYSEISQRLARSAWKTGFDSRIGGNQKNPE